ncbi:hypothetical protein L2E82_40875 [Cichorium intybus]|uniref:Uncharacterized protein n=1 Tax=Cichorium intybus TaxID=13427 RepID=A0ACB9ALH1_CICIN|nr:hypothetical protein L2E82_40875 [Cichorium intybus]
MASSVSPKPKRTPTVLSLNRLPKPVSIMSSAPDNPKIIHQTPASAGASREPEVSHNLPSDPFLDVVSCVFSHKHNGQTSLIDAASGVSISYAELQPLVKSMASGLHHQMGVSKGDVGESEIILYRSESEIREMVDDGGSSIVGLSAFDGVLMPLPPVMVDGMVVDADSSDGSDIQVDVAAGYEGHSNRW